MGKSNWQIKNKRMDCMKEEFEKLILLSYKNRFSIYFKPNNCLVRTYFKDGSQHKEESKTIIEAIKKMNNFLEYQQNEKN